MTFALRAALVQEEKEDLLKVWEKDKNTELRCLSENPAGSGCVLGAVKV